MIDHCQTLLSSFFSALLDALSENDESMAAELLVRLGEPKETHLGFSKGPIAGTQAEHPDAGRPWRACSLHVPSLVDDQQRIRLTVDCSGSSKISPT